MRVAMLLFPCLLASLGCSGMGGKDRVLRPAKVEEFALPPANDTRVMQDPAYPNESKPYEKAKPAIPASMRQAGGGPGGGMSMGGAGQGP